MIWNIINGMDLSLKALIGFLVIYFIVRFFINRKSKKDNLHEFTKSSLNVVFLIIFVPLILFEFVPYAFYFVERLGDTSKYTIHNNDEAVSYYNKAVVENNIKICDELTPGFEMQIAGNTKYNYRDKCIENFYKNID